MGRWARVGWWSLRRAWERFESTIFARARYSEPKMVAMGLFGFVGFPLYWLIWARWFPQPYENLWLRLFGSALCIPMVSARWLPARVKVWLPLHWYLSLAYALPFFFTYMMLQNGANTIWLLSHLCSVFLLVMLFDLGAFLVTSTLGYLLAFTVFLLSPR